MKGLVHDLAHALERFRLQALRQADDDLPVGDVGPISERRTAELRRHGREQDVRMRPPPPGRSAIEGDEDREEVAGRKALFSRVFGGLEDVRLTDPELRPDPEPSR
jgi:hypothetical protein